MPFKCGPFQPSSSCTTFTQASQRVVHLYSHRVYTHTIHYLLGANNSPHNLMHTYNTLKLFNFPNTNGHV